MVSVKRGAEGCALAQRARMKWSTSVISGVFLLNLSALVTWCRLFLCC